MTCLKLFFLFPANTRMCSYSKSQPVKKINKYTFASIQITWEFQHTWANELGSPVTHVIWLICFCREEQKRCRQRPHLSSFEKHSCKLFSMLPCNTAAIFSGLIIRCRLCRPYLVVLSVITSSPFVPDQDVSLCTVSLPLCLYGVLLHQDQHCEFPSPAICGKTEHHKTVSKST